MKKHLSLLLVSCIFLTSCSNAIISHYRGDHHKYQIPPRFINKSVHYQVYKYNEMSIRFATVYKSEPMEEILQENQGHFLKLGQLKLHANSYQFVSRHDKSMEADPKDRAKTMIRDLSSEVRADYVIDFYQTEKIHPGNGFKAIWFLVHALSLGIIPFYTKQRIHLTAEVYDEKRNVIKKSKAVNYVPIWIWTPLIFRSDAMKPWDTHFEKAMYRPTINKLNEKTFSNL